ncbi:hypothetical protein NUU61_007512 [Penicillium alfredii]|uniref:Uncharacterized protein n=1 Tax=Penicillium alfredii TaxID=1506179 RepID=A0A9W9K589_9EURO|nr:uncharacterized protein NUU61_007512 [Penicillium alfredii]KAJ5092642.1 hypothetical protein NUU61_007512 [Penicillium alfredii]
MRPLATLTPASQDPHFHIVICHRILEMSQLIKEDSVASFEDAAIACRHQIQPDLLETIDGGRHDPRQSSEPLPGGDAEPKQPGNIQDLLEYRLDMAGTPKNTLANAKASLPNGTLTKKDIKAILSGAPHFLLERGKHGHWYPQVIFPWDEHNPSIQRMGDRKPLPHASFTLSTLHAHLPVPDDWAVKGGVPIRLHDWTRTGACNRATFDIGVFEVPNMLSNNGREPGTIGFRHFLELSVADAVRYVGPEEPRQPPNFRRVSTLPASEAFELMESFNKPYTQCQSGAVHDRHRLICQGPSGWKRIGVRDINLRTLVKRLDHLREFRHDMLRDGSTKTILDIESPHELHCILHTNFLHPRPPPSEVMPGHPQSLKSQIKTLAIVLATPGAWIDFSLPEWRFRAGQALWETPPHEDGDCLEPSSCGEGAPRESSAKAGLERKWFLIQMLLAAELLLRLDAFVRVDMLHDLHGGQITMQGLRHFDKLRTGKVNWDLVVVRRFFDSLDITCASPQNSNGVPQQPSTNQLPEKPRRFSLLDAITRRGSSAPVVDLRSAWECQLSSSHVRQQLEGLYVFAENIGWPRLDTLKATLEQKLGSSHNPVLPDLEFDGRASLETPPDLVAMQVAKAEMYTRSSSRRRVRLHSSCADDGDPHRQTTLGWISRSWLSGFVIPGEGISHLLMATLLENDADALERLGTMASLYGGFVYRGQSWWSKACIVGRVLSSSEGAKTCMGWIGSKLLPHDTTTLKSFEGGWFEVVTREVVTSSSKPRIRQGGKLAMESSPLGVGDIAAKEFTLPTDQAAPDKFTVTLEALSLAVDGSRPPHGQGITVTSEVSVSLSLKGTDPMESPRMISMPLRYNVRFISAQQCRPPLGFASSSFRQEDDPTQATPDSSKYTRLPGHPLHRSYEYRHVPLASLPDTPAPQSKSASRDEFERAQEVYIVDARGGQAKETFARAWCASVGCHAIISRSGRTCVACCIREARAIDVPVVVRVSD